MYAVVVENLVKKFGKVKALDGLTFSVREGEIFGLVGPNGAGKTTTLRIIATLLYPTSGSVKVFGLDTVREADEVRKLISYLPEEAGTYENLTGYEFLEFFASLYTDNKEDMKRMVSEAIRIANLGERIYDKTKTYSKGMKRRLLVARTLMVNPRLAILDEPTSGLDTSFAVQIRNIVKDYNRNRGTTILLSSHNMLEVEYLCDRVALINQGKIVAMGSPRELKEKYSAENLEEVFIKIIGGASP